MQTRDAVLVLHNFLRILPASQVFRLPLSKQGKSSLLLLQNISQQHAQVQKRTTVLAHSLLNTPIDQ